MPLPKKTKTTTKKTAVGSKKVAQKKAIAKIPKKAKQADDKTIKEIVAQVVEEPKVKKNVKKEKTAKKVVVEKIAPKEVEQLEKKQEEKLISDSSSAKAIADKQEEDLNITEEEKIETVLESEDPDQEIEQKLDIEQKEESEEENIEDEYREIEDNQVLDKTNLDEVYDFEDINESADNDPKQKKKVSLTLYRKIALSFIILTLVLLAVIFYFTFVKVIIKIKTSEEIFNQNLITDIYDSDGYKGEIENKDIVGVVQKINVNLSKKYPSTGSELIDKEVTGSVNIINKYSKDQPLVVKTRLLSPDGKLFRISKTIKVPAGETVEVEIYADKSEPEMAIKPTIFTIPGLWSGLQDKIYAESKESFIYAENTSSFISKADIENAIDSANKELIKKAKTDVAKMYENYDNFIYKINDDTLEQDISGEVNDEVEEFTIDTETDVIIVAFNDKKIKDLAYQKLIEDVPYDKKLVKLNSESFSYNLNNYDLTEGIASLNIVFSGELSFDDNIGTLVEREKLVGLTKEQLEDYLKGRNDISSFEIDFWPSFISKVPNIVDRIIIEVE